MYADHKRKGGVGLEVNATSEEPSFFDWHEARWKEGGSFGFCKADRCTTNVIVLRYSKRQRKEKGGGQFISTGVKTCNHLGCTLLGQWSKHATRNSSSFISGPSSCHSKTAATQTTAQIPTHRVIPTLRYCDMLSKIPWDVSVQSHYMVQLKYSNTEKRLLWLPLGLTRRKLFTWILEKILRIHIETYIKPRWIKGKTYSY